MFHACGPSGGDGGNGAASTRSHPNDNTLLRYRYNREFKADRGRHGEGPIAQLFRRGHDSEGPVGTLAFDDQTGEPSLISPLRAARSDRSWGAGGRGNQHFASPGIKPRAARGWFPGEERHLRSN